MNSTKSEMGFSEEVVWQVWSKGYPSSNDPMMWRKDECGAWIFRGDHRNRDTEYGWEIDHVVPASEGGTDDISNLRPMHWENMSRNEDGGPACRVTSNGSYNTGAPK